MNEVSGSEKVLPDDVATLPIGEVGKLLSLAVSRVHQLVRDGQLLALRRDGDHVVPADFLVTGDDGVTTVVKGLPGTVTVLRDGGYSDADILRWLFTEDESLSGTPMGFITAGRHREIKRRAQAMAF